jgi:hypothetical protein
MKENYKRVPTRFAPETRFEIKPVPANPFRAWQETEFEGLKSRLLLERLEDVWDPNLNSQLRRAANEAASLAWLTSYPVLLFPALFAEKADAALVQAGRQREIRQRTRELMTV